MRLRPLSSGSAANGWRQLLGQTARLHAAPELVVKVLSPDGINERRDREAKLKLYLRRGVHEYWIIDWRLRQVEVYRRHDLDLRLIGTLYESDSLETPLLPGFACRVGTLGTLFEGIPAQT